MTKEKSVKTTGMSEPESFLRDLVSTLKDEDTSLVSDGLASAEWSTCVDTGCYALNALVCAKMQGGGIPHNKFLGLAGKSATGKTFFMLAIVANFLASDPRACVFIYDSESTINRQMLLSRGIDPNRVVIAEMATIQQFKTHVMRTLEAYKATGETRPPLMMVLDSLGQLATEAEINYAMKGEDKRDMSRTQLIRGAFRVIRLKAAKLSVPMIITNHTYAGIGPYAPPEVIQGGGGFLYAADTILMLSKKKDLVDKKVVGVFVTAKTYKSRLSKENQQVELKLNYNTGLDKYYGLRDLAEAYGVLKKEIKPDGKVGAKYVIGGKKYWTKEVDAEPDLLFKDPEALAELEKAVAREFSYGGAADELTSTPTLEKIDPETGEILAA